jgi:hypothetical protein
MANTMRNIDKVPKYSTILKDFTGDLHEQEEKCVGAEERGAT